MALSNFRGHLSVEASPPAPLPRGEGPGVRPARDPAHRLPAALRCVGKRVALLILTVIPPAAQAQDTPNRVFPPGGRRGTTVTLTFPQMVKEESATLVVDGE